MLDLLDATLEFFFYHLLITLVDRVSRLPRHSTPSELARLYRENLALKAQVCSLVREREANSGQSARRVSLATRAAQVFAYLLTRGNGPFHDYYLSASPATIKRWLARFRRGPFRKRPVRGRPALAEEIVALIVKLKTENGGWGARRIQEELRRLGIKVSQPTVQKVLRDHGFDPLHRHRPFDMDRYRSTARDLIWALDFFAVRTAQGLWAKALVIIDLHTREILDLRVYDGWEPSSVWTIQALQACLGKEERKPEVIVHDHGSQFYGQFERQLRVLEIEQRRTPVALPFVNGRAERAIKSIRFELLNHVRARDAEDLQWYLDEYRRYANAYRAHQALGGQTPAAFAAQEPQAKVIDLETFRRRRVVRHSFAHGLLNAYELVEDERASAPHGLAA